MKKWNTHVLISHARRSLSTVGGHSGQSTPPTTVLLSFTFISPPRNGVKSHSRCGTESWTKLELAFQVLWFFCELLDQITGSQRLLASCTSRL